MTIACSNNSRGPQRRSTNEFITVARAARIVEKKARKQCLDYRIVQSTENVKPRRYKGNRRAEDKIDQRSEITASRRESNKN
jgi:hypothetical protein